MADIHHRVFLLGEGRACIHRSAISIRRDVSTDQDLVLQSNLPNQGGVGVHDGRRVTHSRGSAGGHTSILTTLRPTVLTAKTWSGASVKMEGCRRKKSSWELGSGWVAGSSASGW